MALPHDENLRWIVSEYAHLRAAHGEAIGVPSLVEPTGDYFPDAFSPSAEGVATFLKRMLSYSPVPDGVAIELAFLESDASAGGGCASGACGTASGATSAGAEAEPRDEGYRLRIPVRDVGDAAILGASLARCVGGMILGEAGEDVTDGERFARAEVAATLSGFGVLLLTGACVYTKSCGGLRAHQATALDVPSSAVALALFLRLHGAKPGLARRHLETTQREAFDEALAWVDARPKLVEALRLHPESLRDGVFPLEEARGVFARLFGSRSAEPEIVAPAKPRRVRTVEEEQKLAEDRAIVEAALRG
jgi:hypothetical protein